MEDFGKCSPIATAFSSLLLVGVFVLFSNSLTTEKGRGEGEHLPSSPAQTGGQKLLQKDQLHFPVLPQVQQVAVELISSLCDCILCYSQCFILGVIGFTYHQVQPREK